MDLEAINIKTQLATLASPATTQAEDTATLVALSPSPAVTEGNLDTQSTIREKIFLNAISKLEKELLRVLLGVAKETEPSSSNTTTYNSLRQSAPAGTSNSESSQLSEALLADFIKLQDPERTNSPETKLAIKLLTDLTKAKNADVITKAEDPRVTLLKLLDNITSASSPPNNQDSEIISTIKKQNIISAEMRGTILQNIEAASAGDKLLFEGFLDRRGEIVDIKREIISILSGLEQSMVNTEVPLKPLSDDINDLIPKYLMLLLSESTDKLTEIENKLPEKEIRLLLLAFKENQSSISLFDIAHRPIESQQFPEKSLIPTLLVDELVNQLNEYCELGTDHGVDSQLGLSSSTQLKDILKSILTKTSSNNLSIKTSPINVPDYNELPLAENKLLQAISVDSILAELNAGVLNKTSQSTESEQVQLSGKILAQSSLIKELFLKFEQALKSNAPLLEFKPIRADEVAEIALSSLRISIEIKSPELFKASSQFLRSSIANKDLIQSLTQLLIPILEILSSGIEDDNISAKNELKSICEQLDNFRASSTKAQIKHKDTLLQIVDKSVKLFESIAQSDLDNNKISYEKKLIESLGRESLTKLNALADKTAQPSILTLGLQHPQLRSPLEICSTRCDISVSEEDSNNKKNQTLSLGAETIDCSILLPNLGECGISIKILGNNLHLSLCNQNQAVIDTAVPLISQLESRLRDLDFENPRIELNCAKPKSVKPEWLLELLGLG